MARSFNGSSDTLVSASTIDLSAHTKVTTSCWAWVNNFSAGVFQWLFSTAAGGANGIDFYVNDSGTTNFLSIDGVFGHGAKTLNTNPSGGAWHHVIINWDGTVTGKNQVAAVYIDGTSQALTDNEDTAVAKNFGNLTLYLGARNGSSWFPGRLAEMAIWGGINFSQTDVDNLYNSGNGTAATNVQSGSLTNYWQICGTDSPEPATVGGVNLTVTGTSQATHPISGTGICGGAPATTTTWASFNVQTRFRRTWRM